MGKLFRLPSDFSGIGPGGEKRLLRQLSEGEMIYKIDFYDFRRLKLLSARFPSRDDGNLLLSGARLFIFRHLNRVRACR
jgi:trans-aconitate methyltransferase